jgi:hypothetical protein
VNSTVERDVCWLRIIDAQDPSHVEKEIASASQHYTTRILIKGGLIAKFNQEAKAKTYNSACSLVVTHLTTYPPVRCLNRAERTGSLVVSCPNNKDTLNFPVNVH